MNPRRLQSETSLSMSIASSSLRCQDLGENGGEVSQEGAEAAKNQSISGHSLRFSVAIVAPSRDTSSSGTDPDDPHRVAEHLGGQVEAVDAGGVLDVGLQAQLAE